MGDMAYLVFRQLLVMTVICVVALIFSRWKHFGEREGSFLSYLLLYVVTSCMIIDSYNIPFDPEKLILFLIMLLLSVLSFLLWILFSSFLFGKPKSEEDDKRLSMDKMAIVYSNAGYIGIPIVNAVLGEEAVFYLMVYILTFNVFLWIHGQYLMTRTFSLKAIVTKPVVIASAFSILLFLSPWQLPYVLASAVHQFASLNTTLSMVVLGISFAGLGGHMQSLPLSRIARLVLLRLVIVPMLMLLILFLCKPLLSFHPVLEVISLILLIVAACPVGMASTNFALMYHKDYTYSSLSIALSTMLCVITLPLCTAMGEYLILS